MAHSADPAPPRVPESSAPAAPRGAAVEDSAIDAMVPISPPPETRAPAERRAEKRKPATRKAAQRSRGRAQDPGPFGRLFGPPRRNAHIITTTTSR